MILHKWQLVHISQSGYNPMSYIYNDNDTINLIMKDVAFYNEVKVIYTRIFYLRN